MSKGMNTCILHWSATPLSELPFMQEIISISCKSALDPYFLKTATVAAFFCGIMHLSVPKVLAHYCGKGAIWIAFSNRSVWTREDDHKGTSLSIQRN